MNSPVEMRDLLIPLSAEEVSIEKRRFVKSDVRIRVGTVVRDASINESLTEERVEVEHVPVGRYVDAAPAMRQEGETTIISIVEEVIERRLILKEEVHLRRVRTTRMHNEMVALREERVTVERTSRAAPEGPGSVQNSSAGNPQS